MVFHNFWSVIFPEKKVWISFLMKDFTCNCCIRSRNNLLTASLPTDQIGELHGCRTTYQTSWQKSQNVATLRSHAFLRSRADISRDSNEPNLQLYAEDAVSGVIPLLFGNMSSIDINQSYPYTSVDFACIPALFFNLIQFCPAHNSPQPFNLI